MKTSSLTALEARHRRRADALLKLAKWPAIGALIGGGALLVVRVFGPSLVDQLGTQGGESFARGVNEAQEKIAAIKRQLSISGWGTYR